MIYLFGMICLTAIELTPGGSSTEHIYTQTISKTTQSTQTIHRTTQPTQTTHRTTQSTQTIHRTTQFTNQEECGSCEVCPGIYCTTEEKAQKNFIKKHYYYYYYYYFCR